MKFVDDDDDDDLAIIIGTVRSLRTWLWGRYHVPQNAFLVIIVFCCCM